MVTSLPLFTSLLLPLLAPAAAAYRWPDYMHDELEHLLVDNAGYNDAGFATGVKPCSIYIQGPQTTGRQTSAQWMRVGFHDFSTADVAAGTGGVDASIGFETNRPENSGNAMNDSLSYWAVWVNQQASMADMVALGYTVATAACAGPVVPFKGGRVSATQAGDAGVPEPDQEITPMLARFAGAGFSQTEAIQLTACGHTVGSVHHAGFPLIVGTEAVSPNNTQGGIHFDSTVDRFDNGVVTDYLRGNTSNQLVTSFNVSQRSDFRVYNSDGNATMQTLADPSAFQSTCNTVFQKMLNTVPKGVSLQDIDPQPVKPVNVQLTTDSCGNLLLTGAVRLLGSQFSPNPSRKVTLHLKSRTGEQLPDFVADANSADSTGQSFITGGDVYYHTFAAPVLARKGISSFTISVSDSNTQYNNGGSGYQIQDDVMWVPQNSTFNLASPQAASAQVYLSAAVRKAAKPKSVNAVFTLPTPMQGTQAPQLTTQTASLSFAHALNAYYDLYTASASLPNRPYNATGNIPAFKNMSMARSATFDLSAALSNGHTSTDAFRKLRVLTGAPW